MSFALQKSFIVFDDPSKTYAPGDVVSGKVTFKTTRSVPARYLKIEWDGLMYTKIPEVHEIHSKQFFAHSKVVWQACRGNNILPAGSYTYPFSFTLPSTCQPSFRGKFGETEYFVKVILNRPWKSDDVVERSFIVSSSYSIPEKAPDMMMGARYSNFRVSGTIFKDGQFSMKVRMPTRAFLPGEIITATVDIENNSSKPIRRLKAQLIQQSHYHQRPQLFSCPSVDSRSCPLEDRRRRDAERVIRTGKWRCSIAPFSKKTVKVQVDLPSNVVPVFENSMMSIGYLVSFSAKNTSWTRNKLECNARISIGSSKDPEPEVPAGDVPPPPYDPKWRM